MDRLQYVFVIFFVTLGPIKSMAPFMQATAGLDAAAKRSVAFKGTLIATAVGLFIVFIGDGLRTNWGIGAPDLMITFGILLLISSLEQLRAAEHPVPPADTPAPAEPPSTKGLALSPVAFPIIITPYGIVALLLFAAMTPNTAFFVEGVFGLFLAIMVMNLLAMMYVRQIFAVIKPPVLRAFGWVLTVLQASLAVFAIMQGLRTGLFAAGAA